MQREVAIQQISTSKYIAINSKAKLVSKEILFSPSTFNSVHGRLERYGRRTGYKKDKKDVYDVECKFKEGIFENYYTVYTSLKWGVERMTEVRI